MDALDDLAMAVFLFALVKVFFLFLSWYLPDDADRDHRKSFDNLFDHLDGMTIREVLDRSVKRLVSRMTSTFPSKARAGSYFFLFFVTFNLISIAVSAVVGIMLRRGQKLGEALVTFTDIFGEKISVPSIIHMTLVCSVFAMLSLAVTWYLVVRASNSLTFFGLIIHLILDIMLTILAVFWIIYGMTFFGGPLEGHLPGDITELIVRMKELYHRHGFLAFVPLAAITASTSLPTFVYVFLCGLLLFLRMLPKRFQNFCKWTIYQITTDEKPVLHQVGTFAGALTAIFMGLLALVRQLSS